MYQSEKRQYTRHKELTQLKPLVQQVRREMPRLGTRKLYYLLKVQFKELGIKIGRDAFFDYLRSQNMLIKPKKHYTKTTYSKHWLKKYPNLLKEVKPERPEQVFVSDITFIKTRDKTHYLSLITDAFSRKIMGYKLSDDMSTENVVQALKMAIKQRITNYPLIHHSDRGLQYCSYIYQLVLNKNKITPSMTDGYDCYQNALAERINGILKNEFLIYKCNTKKELELLIRESINIYNNSRPHWALNLKTPNFIHEKTCEYQSTGFS